MKAATAMVMTSAHADLGAWDIAQAVLVAGIVVLAAGLALFWAIKRLLTVVAPPGEKPCGGACACEASSGKNLGRQHAKAKGGA